jgi:DNA-directed RNA polymerase specialized sigma24 family protein
MATPDLDLHRLLASAPEQGWSIFIERYTPALLAHLERAGLHDPDEAMEVYVLVCERLADRRCARLRRHDPSKGPLTAWLGAVVRNVIVDWARSRRGRARLFGAIRDLDVFDQQVFELFYWQERRPGEMAEMLGAQSGTTVTLAMVFDALARVDGALQDRHRRDLLALAARRHAAAPLEDNEGVPVAVASAAPDAEATIIAREHEQAMSAALATLPAEDAAIVRLRYVQGLSLSQIRRLLALDALPESRLRGILARLADTLRGAGMSAMPLAGGR